MGYHRAALEQRIFKHLDSGNLDKAATEALRGYGPEILGYLISVIRNEAAARDVFGEFSEDLWKGLPGFRKESCFRAWAYKIAWNAAQTFWRDPFRRHVRRLDTSEYSLLVNQLRASSVHSDPMVKLDRLTKLRASLDPDEQTLLVLRLDRNLSWRDVAVVMSADGQTLDSATVRQRFARLKERLLRQAVDEGLLDSRDRNR